jgi:hypothetical protein
MTEKERIEIERVRQAIAERLKDRTIEKDRRNWLPLINEIITWTIRIALSGFGIALIVIAYRQPLAWLLGFLEIAWCLTASPRRPWI